MERSLPATPAWPALSLSRSSERVGMMNMDSGRAPRGSPRRAFCRKTATSFSASAMLADPTHGRVRNTLRNYRHRLSTVNGDQTPQGSGWCHESWFGCRRHRHSAALPEALRSASAIASKPRNTSWHLGQEAVTPDLGHHPGSATMTMNWVLDRVERLHRRRRSTVTWALPQASHCLDESLHVLGRLTVGRTNRSYTTSVPSDPC